MSYHCSLSAIGYPRSKGSRKFFIPPPRKIIQVPWNSVEEMLRQVGHFPGEWKLSTNQFGHLLGLPHITGAVVARCRTRMLFWTTDKRMIEVHAGNFVGHYEEEE